MAPKSDSIIVTALVAVLAGSGSAGGVSFFWPDRPRSDEHRVGAIERDVAVIRTIVDSLGATNERIQQRLSVLERFMWRNVKKDVRVKIKNGVDMGGVKPEIIIAVIAANDVWRVIGQELVITRGRERPDDIGYSRASRHYLGMAVDLRTRYFNHHEAKKARDMLAERLGEDYFVMLESDHIHVEYKPS